MDKKDKRTEFIENIENDKMGKWTYVQNIHRHRTFIKKTNKMSKRTKSI